MQNRRGLAVRFSSGTSGLLSVIPGDKKTFLAAQYGFAKAASSMTDFFSADSIGDSTCVGQIINASGLTNRQRL